MEKIFRAEKVGQALWDKKRLNFKTDKQKKIVNY